MVEQVPGKGGLFGVQPQHTTQPLQDLGRRRQTPLLLVRVVVDAHRPLAFYQEVFGARLFNTFPFGDVVVHAELQFADGRLRLGAAQPDYHLVAPGTDGDRVTYSLALHCPNVDDVVAKAGAHGATLRNATTNFVSGDWYASIRDPFGVWWSVTTRVGECSAGMWGE